MSLPTSSDGGIYTTADGRVLSLPEGIVTNQSGHLINPADGSILTTEDGTPLMLPEGAILQAAAPVSSSITSGTMVSSVSEMTHVTQADPQQVNVPAQAEWFTGLFGTILNEKVN